MLHERLSAAGFFPIQWSASGAPAAPGRTYVLPNARGVVRVFVPASGDEVELYTGRLLNGELHYRGPLTCETQLQQMLAKVI